jgi:NTP pyrophosphatase (non-canonical NTP hydrolase)
MIELNERQVLSQETSEVFCILQEECAEVTQAISKIFRFGMDSVYNGRTNKERLEEETGDLLAMIDIMISKGLVSETSIRDASKAKKNKLATWSNIKV